jgi:predicted thioesterase
MLAFGNVYMHLSGGIWMKTGIKGHTEQIVDESITADTVGSGLLPVFATPAMIALIEKTAWESIADELEPGQGTVGIKVDVAHISATPIGMKVWCDTELV